MKINLTDLSNTLYTYKLAIQQHGDKFSKLKDESDNIGAAYAKREIDLPDEVDNPADCILLAASIAAELANVDFALRVGHDMVGLISDTAKSEERAEQHHKQLIQEGWPSCEYKPGEFSHALVRLTAGVTEAILDGATKNVEGLRVFTCDQLKHISWSSVVVSDADREIVVALDMPRAAVDYIPVVADFFYKLFKFYYK